MSDEGSILKVNKSDWRRSLLIGTALFLLALVPRAVDLGVFITPDEPRWMNRSASFLEAVLAGDWIHTIHVGETPGGVTTKWCGSAGIVARYLLLRLHPSAGAALQAGTLPEFLRWLQSDPHNPLEVMAAVRWPIALIVSASVAGLYLLARELLAERVALLGAILLALEPFDVALSRVLHLDALVASLMALSLLSLAICLKSPRLSLLLVFSGTTAGLAVANKVSALFLLPFAGLMALAAYLAQVPGTSNISAWQRRKALHLAVALAVWAGTAGLTLALAWPAVWADPAVALQRLLGDSGELAGAGHEQFFLGRVVDDPGAWFFPVVWLFRASPLTLLGVAASLLPILRLCMMPFYRWQPGDRRPRVQGSSPSLSRAPSPNWGRAGVGVGEGEGQGEGEARRLIWLWAYVGLFVAFITLSPKKLDRYVLPIFPAVALLAAAGLWEWAEMVQQRISEPWRRFSQPSPGWLKADTRATYLLPLGCLILQAAFLLPHHPYYFTFYNPALGGIRQASQVLLVGWEEGLEQAARYLNAQEGIEGQRVLAWYSALGFNTLFRGESRELSPLRQPADDVWLWYESDYVVFYINQVQRGLPDARTLAFLRSLEPEYTVRLKGLEYAWVYRVPQAVPEEAYPFAQVVLVDLDDRVRLLGCEGGEVAVGADGQAVLPLTLYWQNLKALDANYRLYLKLINGVYHVWGQQEGYPLWDGFMTSTWQEGVVIRDDRQIEILPGTPPGAYQVAVNWLDPYAGLSLQPAGGGDLLLGPFGLPPRPPPPLESLGIEHPLSAELGGQVRFLGYNLAGDWRPGGSLHLTLFWQALAEMDQDYTVFTHLTDERGSIWGQKDNQPVDGFYPTGGWARGEIVRDQYDLTLSPEAPPGLYRIVVGMYSAETGQRLVVGQDGPLPPADKIVLGEFMWGQRNQVFPPEDHSGSGEKTPATRCALLERAKNLVSDSTSGSLP